MRNDWDRNDEYLISAANDWKQKKSGQKFMNKPMNENRVNG